MSKPRQAQTDFGGIPEAIWIDEVEDYLKETGIANAKVLFAKLDESYQKYKWFEGNLNSRRARLNSQVPDLTASLEAIKSLKTKADAGQTSEQYYKVNSLEL